MFVHRYSIPMVAEQKKSPRAVCKSGLIAAATIGHKQTTSNIFPFFIAALHSLHTVTMPETKDKSKVHKLSIRGLFNDLSAWLRNLLNSRNHRIGEACLRICELQLYLSMIDDEY